MHQNNKVTAVDIVCNREVLVRGDVVCEALAALPGRPPYCSECVLHGGEVVRGVVVDSNRHIAGNYFVVFRHPDALQGRVGKRTSSGECQVDAPIEFGPILTLL